MTARERKQKAQARSREAVSKATGSPRRAGRVQTHRVDPRTLGMPKSPMSTPDKTRLKIKVDMHKPKGLSDEARFMDYRPKNISPIEWLRLFTPDEELWETMAEEVAEMSPDQIKEVFNA